MGGGGRRDGHAGLAGGLRSVTFHLAARDASSTFSRAVDNARFSRMQRASRLGLEKAGTSAGDSEQESFGRRF